MGQSKRLIWVGFAAVLLAAVFLKASPKALALAPIDQVCSTGVAGSDLYSFIGTRDGNQIFVPTKNTLDAIAVRVKTEIGNNAQVTAKIVKGTTAPGEVIAEKTQAISNNEEWIIFDFDNVPLGLDQYAIVLRSLEPNHAIWKMTDGNCYDRGYAVDGDAVMLDRDYGFAVYAYDATNGGASQPSSSGNSGSSDQDSSSNSGDDESSSGVASTSGDDPPGSSGSNESSAGQSATASGSRTPTADELKAEILKDYKNNNGTTGGGVLMFILSRLIWPALILFVIFVFGLGAVILLILARRKRNQAPPAAPPPAQPEAAKTVPSQSAPPQAEKPRGEMKEAIKEEKHVVVQKPVRAGGKKKTIWIVAIIILVLIILGLGGFFLIKKVKSWFGGSGSSSSSYQSGEFKASLKPTKIQTDSDQSRAVTKTVSSAGVVLQTQGADGTLYTLTVPVDAAILPSQVTMRPLTSVPVSGYKDKVIGGVELSGKFSFIRPTYLTVQLNQQKSDKKLGFNYCAPGSRGFDPEVCAGLAGIPFTFGIAPGKIVAFSSEEKEQVLLQPTIYTGLKDAYTAQVFSPGAYFADNATRQDIEKFAETTFAGASDFTNRTEVLMHLAALGGKLDPYKSEIERFAREKKDYPREVLKAAIIARAVGDKETAEKRIDDYSNTIVKKSKDIRSAFTPLNRYAALIRQVKYTAEKKHRFAQAKRNVAYALEDYDPSGNGGNDNYDWPIPDYEGDNGTDYGEGWTPRTWQEIWNELFPPSTVPPDLRDWSDAEAEAAAQKKAEDELEQNCRNEINDKNNTACEKAQAIRTIIALGRMKGTDYDSFSKIVGECAKKCTTMQECEDMGDMGDRWGNSGISNSARERIAELLQQNKDCDLAHKEGLADYGKNTCEDTGDGSDLPEVPPPTAPPSLDL